MKIPILSAHHRLLGAWKLWKNLLNGNAPSAQNYIAPQYINILNQFESCCGPVSGRRILEIGSDSKGAFLEYLTSVRQPAEAIGINISFADSEDRETFSLLKEDVRRLSFDDNRFDVILSISAFEHIQDFDVALSEMFRVLKPGGQLFAEFAPIWSGVWGHHLWLDYDGEVINWLNTPMPPYAHLLMEETNLQAWIMNKYEDEKLCQLFLDFVYRSEEQNRLFFSDFESIVDGSDFETVFFVGLPDLPLRKGYEVDCLDTVMNSLRCKFSDKSGFGYLGISMLLNKPDE